MVHKGEHHVIDCDGINADGVCLSDIIDIAVLQTLQDMFAEIHGVGSVIFDLEGNPLTAFSNFSEFCQIVRSTERGLQRCVASDRRIGNQCGKGQTGITSCDNVEKIMDGAFPITIQGRHIATWGIGQVISEDIDEDQIRRLAREIGTDEDALVKASKKITKMPRSRFSTILDFLRAISEQVSLCAYNNLQLRHLITERNRVQQELESRIEERTGTIRHANMRLQQEIEERTHIEEALRRSESVYRDLVENINEIVYSTDERGIVTYVSPAVTTLGGYDPSEIIGRPFTDFVYSEDLLKRWGQFKMILSGADEPTEYRYVTKSGDIRWVKTSARPIISNGQVTGVRGILTDITSLKEIEQKLLQSESRYKQLVEGIPDVIYSFSSKRGGLYWSQQVESVLGYSVAYLSEHPSLWHDSIHPDDLRLVDRAMQEFDRDSSYNLEYRIRDAQGDWRWFHDRSIGKRENGDEIIIDGIARDITARKVAEEKSKEYLENLEKIVDERTEELYQALRDAQKARDWIDGIVKSIADGLIVTDNLDRIVLMNRAAEDLFDIRFSEVINQSVDLVITNETLRNHIKTSRNHHRTGVQFYFELPGTRPERPRIVRGLTSAIEVYGSEKMGVITTVNDVTYEKEIDRMKTQFITTAAHELRTPLTSILGFSEILFSRDNINEEDRKKYLSHIYTQSHDLATIVSDLIDLSRVEAGLGVALKREFIDIADLVKDATGQFQGRHPQYTFELNIPEKPVMVSLDQQRIRQAMENILSNAVKFSPYGGVIDISGEIADTSYQITVRDQGVGMIPEQVEMVFDTFFKADVSNTAPEGTGLGMTMLKHIIEAHAGTVSIESQPGRGTTVHIRLPL